ncbi:intermembrane lipid transfer protein VPS13C-like, partial [Mantella aurantiaca]
MLESVVADLLNKFLGDYVENLDRSQLKLGIWGGNVSLENLRIRENALSELDVPFKVKAGLIEKLTLKIPWKNLYGDAVVATLEGLYLLVVPGASMKYDAEKEEKNLQETKQRELQRIEEALQKAAEKDKPKEEKKDTFLEKLAAQVIKNLQVKITNIHIRYEDDITDVGLPVSVGITLAELSLQTSNESWTPCILNEAAKIIYKLVRLDSFGTYWNSLRLSPLCVWCYHQSVESILADLKSSVMAGRGEPRDYQYIIKPVSASAKLYMNPNAELELQTPKLDWNMEVQHVAIELSKPQYLSMIDLLESVDYMVRNVPYRKYRPAETVMEDSRKWWDYAISSILEVHIRRRTRMWTWRNIVQHRENLKAYKNVYKVKLTQSKFPEETLKQLQALESKLDLFNIILVRQQAQAEVVRSGQKVLAKKSAQSGEKKSGGWFGGFWGRKDTSSKKEDSDELSVPEKIDDLMTPEEKKKLFTAIGYSETPHNLTLPRAYVAYILGFKLVSTSITIRETAQAPETLKIQIIDLSTKVFQRPGAQALKVDAKLEHWYVTGLRQQNIVPSLVSSIGSSKSSLLKIQYETNPENSSADQVLILQSQPVEIIYDAVTINALSDFFQTHRGMDLEQLTSATLMKLEEIKEKTAAGLTHMIETRKVLDLRINLQPSFLLLPKSGFYYDEADVIIVDFGSFQLTSINQGCHPAANTSSLEELMDKAYDKFHVQINKVQILFGRSGEDWKAARSMNSSPLHILQPLDIDMKLGKAMVERDSRMPRFKVSGDLPSMRLRVSDRKLQGVYEVISSIPRPQQHAATPSTQEKRKRASPIYTPPPTTCRLPLHPGEEGKSNIYPAPNNMPPPPPPGRRGQVQYIPRPQQHAATPSTREKRIAAAAIIPALSRRSEKLLTQEMEKSLFLEESSDSDEEFFDSRDSDPSFVRKDPPTRGRETAAETAPEELTDLHLKFEVKEVVLELTKQLEEEERTVLVFRIQQLGTEGYVRTFDLQAVSYLRTISLDYYDLQGLQTQQPLHLINSSDIEDRDLLKVEYIKADKNGPRFQTTFENTEQILKVTFSSMELLLHSQALLSAIAFITESMPSVTDKSEPPPSPTHQQPDKETFIRKATKPSRDKDLIAFKVFAKLNSFSLNVWDETNHIAEIKILGLDSSVFLESSKIDVFARLKDIIVNDVNPQTIHKKAVCIMEEEVFSFNLTLYPEATQGEAYKDVSKVDGKVSLRVGCMKIVFLNKFIGSLLGFLNNFQAAKEQVSAATAQAAHRAATSVKDLAERSFRLLMDIHLKAPVIVIPQSSLSSNALVADLGLIRIQNQFRLISSNQELAPVIDCMTVSLTEFKLSRTVLDGPPAQSDIQLLYPINLSLAVNRNLAASWYHQIPGIEVKGHLNSMDVCVSQEDLNVLFCVLVENLGEGGERPTEPEQVSVHSESVRFAPDGLQASVTSMRSSNEIHSSDPASGKPADLGLLLNFQIKKVIVQLMNPVRESPLHDIQISQLGLEMRVGSHEMTAAVYLQRISMTCNDFKGPDGGSLLLVNSSDDTKEHLLTLEYVKADPNGPGFKTDHNNTVQRLSVSMSSLDLILHTQALLSLLNFLSGAVPTGDPAVTPRTREPKTSLGRQRSVSSKPGA